MRTDLKTFVKMIKQELYIMTKKQKRISIVLFVIVFLGSMVELLGVTAIIPFIQSLLDIDGLKTKWYIKAIIDLLHIQKQNQIIYIVAFFVNLIYIFKNVFLLWSLNIQYKFRYTFQQELSSRMLSAYLRRPYEFFLNINSAQVLRSLEGDVSNVFGIYDHFFKFLAGFLNIILISIFLIYTDWIMAIGILTLSFLCFIIITYVFKKLLKGVGDRQRGAMMQTKKYAYQAINGIKEIHVMKKNEFFIQKYDDAYLQKSKMERKYMFLNDCPEKVIEMSCIVGIIGIVCLRLAIGVDIESFVPKLSVFAVAAFRILPSISRLIGCMSGMIYLRPSLEDAYNQLLEVEQYEHQIATCIKENIIEQSINHCIFKDKIEIKNITWMYPNADRYVLNNLNLVIHKGDAIGFIGTSGAGKTTLSDLLLGLFQPLSGGIYVDGTDVYSIPHIWARIVGYVPQTVFLTDDTIRNNIAFGEEECDIDDSKVWSALEQAQFKDVVRDLPNGLDTVVGERGIRFSGGQKQRIAIARALYYEPDIVVLDEATSALDNETEKAVMESIDALQKDKTLIIVAHRLSTLKNCNIIYEIKDGIAVEVDVEQMRRG